jgi:hypothetical protein
MRRKKTTIPRRFDLEALLLGAGMGVISMGIGALIIWAKLTAPPGTSQSTAVTTAQKLTRVLPESIQGRIAIGLGVLFVLFGVFAVLLGIWKSMVNLFPKKEQD